MEKSIDQENELRSHTKSEWRREAVARTLDAFVSSKYGGAIVLFGPWGTGKTHFWKQDVAVKLMKKPWKKRYSYVSLFGITSLQELKIAISIASDEFDSDARRQWLTRPLSRAAWLVWRWLSNMMLVIPRIGPGLSKIADRIGFNMVQNRIICFDDIERRGKSFDLKDFLGLVSYLSEERNCRIVAILNSFALDESDQRTWDETREKVFQGELNFAPSAAQTVELGLEVEKTQKWHASLHNAFIELNVSNIRLVMRGAKFMHLLMDTLSDKSLRHETVDRMSRIVALLVYSIHGRGAGGPPLDRIENQSRFGVLAAINREDQRTEIEKDWDKLISNYQIYLYTKLDFSLVRMVKDGYPDELSLRNAVEEIETSNELNEQRQAWHDAWRLYHDTVAENGDQIISEFERLWPAISAHENSVNLESTARLLRKLNRPDLATRFINQWVSDRAANNIEELDNRELNLFKKIEDPEILAAVDEALARPRELTSPESAFQMLMARGEYPEEAIASIARTQVTEIVRIIEQTKSNNLAATIQKIVDMKRNISNKDWLKASENMIEACKIIAGRSALGESRMRSWIGLDLAHSNGAAQEIEE